MSNSTSDNCTGGHDEYEKTYQFPMFTCEYWVFAFKCTVSHQPDVYMPLAIEFCVFEKLILISSFALIVINIQQLKIYLKHFNIKCQDFRVLTLIIGLLSSLNIFVHYGFLSSDDKSRTFFLIEMMRFLLFFMICYHYTKKASRLLKRKEKIMLMLHVLFICIVVFNLGVGIYMLVGINNFYNN